MPTPRQPGRRCPSLYTHRPRGTKARARVGPNSELVRHSGPDLAGGRSRASSHTNWARACLPGRTLFAREMDRRMRASLLSCFLIRMLLQGKQACTDHISGSQRSLRGFPGQASVHGPVMHAPAQSFCFSRASKRGGRGQHWANTEPYDRCRVDIYIATGWMRAPPILPFCS